MFTSTATNFGSLQSEQIYSYVSTSTEDQIFTIKEAQTGEILGVKKFYSTESADLNVSPIVRPHAAPEIPEITTGFVDQSAFGAITINVTKSGNDTTDVCSDDTLLTLSNRDESEIGLVSTLPAIRYISLGDRELLAMRVDPTLSIRATIEQYAYGWGDSSEDEQEVTPAASISIYTDPEESGIAVFSLTAEYMDELLALLDEPDLEKIIVRVEQYDALAEVVEYQLVSEVLFHVIEPPRAPLRIAWVSSRGSIEHYTMPYITSELYFGAGRRELALRSALECLDVRKAIAEIIDSDRIWIVDEECVEEVTLASESIELAPTQDLTIVEFNIVRND